MFRCQYCGSHIHTQFPAVEWLDLLGKTECERAYDKTHQPHQLAEFYVTKDEGEVIYESENHGLCRIGNLRFWLPDDSNIRTSDQLLKAGVAHDIALEVALQQDQMRQVGKPWFEVRAKNGKTVQDEKFSSFNEALKGLARAERAVTPTHVKYAVDEVLEELKAKQQA